MLFAVSSCECTIVEVLIVVGFSAVVVFAAEVVTAVLVRRGGGVTVSWVEELSKVALVVVGMVVLSKLTVVFTGLVVHLAAAVKVIGRVSVILTVDGGSTTSGLTAGGVIGPDGVFECLGVGYREKVGDEVSSKGVGGALDKVVYLLGEVLLEIVLLRAFPV